MMFTAVSKGEEIWKVQARERAAKAEKEKALQQKRAAEEEERRVRLHS